MRGYCYTESGLDSVIIEGLQIARDAEGEVIYIPNINPDRAAWPWRPPDPWAEGQGAYHPCDRRHAPSF